MSNPVRRLALGLVALACVLGLNWLLTGYLVPFRPPPSNLAVAIPSAVGFFLAMGVLAYFLAGGVAMVFFAGRRSANRTSPSASDFLSGMTPPQRARVARQGVPFPVWRAYLRQMVPALATLVWGMVAMAAFSVIVIPVVVIVLRLISHRTG